MQEKSQREERWEDMDTATRSSRRAHNAKGTEKEITASTMGITTARVPEDEKNPR